MKLKFFDANLYVGKPTKAVYKPAVSAEEAIRALDVQGIEKALIWHIAQHDLSPVEGNRLLSGLITGQKRLYGCWTILPPQTGEVITLDFFDRMKKERIAALRAFPDIHRFMLNRVVFGSFLDEAGERKIPLLLSLKKGISWQGVYGLLKDFPDLTCVLCDIGIWGADRYTWPLLENYGNIYLETSLLALGYGQLEATVRKFGAERIIFGSGFPERYPESSICEVLHADISEAARRKIARENMENLIAGIKS